MLGVVACVAQLPRALVDPYCSSLPSFLTPALPFRRPTTTDLGKFLVQNFSTLSNYHTATTCTAQSCHVRCSWAFPGFSAAKHWHSTADRLQGAIRL